MRGVFIGVWGAKLEFFLDFLDLKRSKRLVFEFKQLYLNLNKKIWTNQIVPRCYRLSALVAISTDRAVPPRPAPMRAVSPTTGGL
jgi:hypothetical protein